MLHDQGEEFENGLFRQLTNLLEVNNLCTTPYQWSHRMHAPKVLPILCILPKKYKLS